jgi:hypothetical protein
MGMGRRVGEGTRYSLYAPLRKRVSQHSPFPPAVYTVTVLFALLRIGISTFGGVGHTSWSLDATNYRLQHNQPLH